VSGTGDVWDRRSVGQEVNGTIAQEEISRIGDQSNRGSAHTHTRICIFNRYIIYIYIFNMYNIYILIYLYI
jgi:hypothetical protein